MFPLNFFTSVNMRLDSENDWQTCRLFHIFKNIHLVQEAFKDKYDASHPKSNSCHDLTLSLVHKRRLGKYIPQDWEKRFEFYEIISLQVCPIRMRNSAYLCPECFNYGVALTDHYGVDLLKLRQFDLQGKSLQCCSVDARRQLAQILQFSKKAMWFNRERLSPERRKPGRQAVL